MSDDSQSLERAARRLADRWTVLVLARLLEQPRTFSELEGAVRGIAPSRPRSSRRGPAARG